MRRAHGLETLPAVRGVPAVTAAQMAEIDRVAIEDHGIALEMLMENASRQVAAAARAVLGGSVAGRRVAVLAGHGSNGGDGLGAARHLLNWGADVTCVVAGGPEWLRPTSRRQFDILASIASAPLAAALDEAEPAAGAAFDEAVAGAELVIDALLGYSASGVPRGPIAALIATAARATCPVLTIDVPSGMHPDTGAAPGAAVRASVTVTLALPKVGLLTPEAAPLVGQLLLADIGIPPGAYARFGIDASPVFRAGDLLRVVLEEDQPSPFS